MSTPYARVLRDANRHQPRELTLIPVEAWPAGVLGHPHAPARVWRSRKYLVQLFTHETANRLTVQRADVTASGAWRDGVTWDELQAIKRQCGFGDRWAVEIFPADADLVNVANMRHLWLLNDPPSFAWTSANVAAAVSRTLHPQDHSDTPRKP